VNLLLFSQVYLVGEHHKLLKVVVTFGLSYVNLMINKDILVKNTQIFIYFNYSLKLVLKVKISKEKKLREYI